MECDEFDEQTKAMLPCINTENGDLVGCVPFGGHRDSCPAIHRPAVAAALREQGQEISRLREKCNQKDDEYAQQVAFSEKMIADLRAELDEREKLLEKYNRSIDPVRDLVASGGLPEAGPASDSCGHVLNVVYLCKTCVEKDLEIQKELNAFYVDKLNKAEAEIEQLKAQHG